MDQSKDSDTFLKTDTLRPTSHLNLPTAAEDGAPSTASVPGGGSPAGCPEPALMLRDAPHPHPSASTPVSTGASVSPGKSSLGGGLEPADDAVPTAPTLGARGLFQTEVPARGLQ